MATYHGLLHDWKTLSATRAISQSAYTVAGLLSMQTGGDQAIIDLAPLSHVSLSQREFERGRLLEDAAMVGIRITASAQDASGAYHWRATIERGEVAA